jgi:hypothetical protein
MLECPITKASKTKEIDGFHLGGRIPELDTPQHHLIILSSHRHNNLTKTYLEVSANEKVHSVQLFRDYPRPPFLYCSSRNILTVLRETLTQYITFNRRGRGDSVLLYSCNLNRHLCEDSDKIPEGRTYILHFSVCTSRPNKLWRSNSIFNLCVPIQ